MHPQMTVNDALVTMADRMASNAYRAYVARNSGKLRGPGLASHSDISKVSDELLTDEGVERFIKAYFQDALAQTLAAAETIMTPRAFNITYSRNGDKLTIYIDPQCRKS